MLRINVEDQGATLEFVLEGRLVGPWVDELRSVWCQRTSAETRQEITVDLCGLTAMDDGGQQLLEELLRVGATLRCEDVMNQYLVEQMSSSSGRAQEACRPCQHFSKQEASAASTTGAHNSTTTSSIDAA